MYALLVSIFSIIPTTKEKTTDGKIAIYILSNGVHTDIVVPVNSTEINWSTIIPYTNTQKKDTTAKFIAFGWGDKGFYLETPTWADLKFSTAFKASCGLGNSAIHTTFHHQLSESDNCKRILISSKQYLNLIAYIKKSLKLDNEKPILINTNANYNAYDAFYEAKGSYSIFHTCNTWANNGLKKCGQKACFWTPLDKGIFYHYK